MSAVDDGEEADAAAPAGPGSIRAMATTSPRTSTRTSATRQTQMLIQNARNTSQNELRISGRKKKVRPTAPSLAMMNAATATTRKTAAA